MREACDYPRNFRSSKSLDETLKFYHIPGISGVDTRSLTRKIRKFGVLKAGFTDNADEIESLVQRLNTESLRTDEVEQVSSVRPYISTGDGYKVVLIDYGKKENIVRELNRRGCDVTVVPYQTSYEEILNISPDGIMVSNRPGNPESVQETIQTIKQLVGKIPFFGICLGHQLFALSQGATSYKMKFGHRGANHPVQNLQTGKVDLTSQNHGYAIDEASIAQTDLEVTHIALNDKSIEGLRHKKYPAFSVQYHPEASPGPHDSNYLFDEFIEMIKLHKAKERTINA